MYEPLGKLMRAGHARSAATFGPGSASRRPRSSARSVIASVAGIAIVASAGMANLSTASAATVTGTLVTNSLTRPGGGAFLPGGGGHFWVSDGVLGLCETVPATASVTKCNGGAKGGQVAFDSVKNLIYVADNSTKTSQVLRIGYAASTDSLGSSQNIQVPNPTAVGGGSGGGRATGVALTTGPDGAQRLYVTYIKSGDVMQVLNPAGLDKNARCIDAFGAKIGRAPV